MTNLTALIVPLLICGICTYAYFKKVDISSAFKTGVFNGISVIKSIFPPILMILSAVYMLRASGFIELLSGVLTPFFSLVGIPPECSMLMLVRPLSGSGATAIVGDIFSTFGVDSVIGLTSAVMMGGSETTFYTLSVYMGSVGIKKSRHALIASVFGDLVGFIVAAKCVQLFFNA